MNDTEVAVACTIYAIILLVLVLVSGAFIGESIVCDQLKYEHNFNITKVRACK